MATDPRKIIVPVLSLALREDEITEGDFDLLYKIAEDKNAPAGRLRRPTPSVPAVTGVLNKADGPTPGETKGGL